MITNKLPFEHSAYIKKDKLDLIKLRIDIFAELRRFGYTSVENICNFFQDVVLLLQEVKDLESKTSKKVTPGKGKSDVAKDDLKEPAAAKKN